MLLDPSCNIYLHTNSISVEFVCWAIDSYIYPICGDIMTIPGLPTRPGFYDVDVDLKTGRVIGLF